MKKFITILACLFVVTASHSQSNFSLKYFGLTIHPFGDQLASIQPYRLDEDAHFVGNIGLFAKYEKFVWEDILAVDIVQAIFSDCSAGMASVSSIGAHILILEHKKNHFYLDLGTTLFIREDWNRFEAYNDDGGYKQTSFAGKNWQYGMYPISLMIEYDCDISEKAAITTSIVPYPVIAIGIGIKYWFSKDFVKSEKLLIPKKRRN